MVVRTTLWLLYLVLYIVVGLGLAKPTYAEPLPVGNNGIASRYPNDAGISADPSVIFNDGFETYTSANQLTSSGNYSNYYQGSNITFDVSTLYAGSKSVRIRMPQSGGEVSNAIEKIISPTRDTLFMRAYTRFAPNFAGVNSAHSGFWIEGGTYGGPGRRPNGTDFFMVMIENSRSGSDPEPGYTHAYVYHPEMDDVYGEHWFPDGSVLNGSQSFGSDFISRPKVNPTRGVWICLEVMVKANTPGSRDGRVAVWQDGVLVADWTGLRLRDVNTVKISKIHLENGGQGSTQINDRWYDNLVIATSYIGPMVTNASPKLPKPPSNIQVNP